MKEGERPVTKLHMTGTVMWKKRELGENIENKGAPREQSEPPGKLSPRGAGVGSTPCSQASLVLTDTKVVGVGGGWEGTGADAPNAGQFLRRHHTLANAIIDTVQMSLCYVRRPDTLLFPQSPCAVTLCSHPVQSPCGLRRQQTQVLVWFPTAR